MSDSPDSCPATSIHVWWCGDCAKDDLSEGWSITNSVQVEESHDCTYFCLLGFQSWKSGGYAGIQQKRGGEKIAIFSVWDSPTHPTTKLSDGDNCLVRGFGHEGVGMQSFKEFKWELGQTVTQTIEARRTALEEEVETWHICCTIQVESTKYKMATYEWKGPRNPLGKPTFYSFIEDWDRRKGADGHLRRRCARFFDPLITNLESSYKTEMKSFTSVKKGKESYAAGKIVQECSEDRCSVFMSTGGPDQMGQQHEAQE